MINIELDHDEAICDECNENKPVIHLFNRTGDETSLCYGCWDDAMKVIRSMMGRQP